MLTDVETEAEWPPKPRLRVSVAELRRRKRMVERSGGEGDILRPVRLSNGKFITIRLRQSRPEDVGRADKDEIWTTADGRKLLPKDMELNHLLNCVKQLEDRALRAMQAHDLKLGEQVDSFQNFACQLYPVYRFMKREVAKRTGMGWKEPDPITPPAEAPEAAGSEPRRKLDFDY